MAVRIYISHTGRYLAYEEPSFKIEDIKSWIAERTGVANGRQILMTAQGRNIKTVTTDTDVFVYDKKILSSESEPPTDLDEQLPGLREPPTTPFNEDSIESWQELLMLQRTWALEVVQAVTSGAERGEVLASKADVISRATEAAWENLRNYVQNLGQKFNATRQWALESIQEQQEVINDWESSANVLAELPVREDVAHILRGQDTGDRKQINTLFELLDIDALKSSEASVSRATEQFRSHLNMLQESMIAAKDDTAKIERYITTVPESNMTPLLQEAETLAKRISSDYEDVIKLPEEARSVATAKRRAKTHQDDILPTLQAVMDDLKQAYDAYQQTRNRAASDCFTALQAISGIQSRLSDLQSGISTLEYSEEEDLNTLSRIFQLPTVYGCTLIEATRRSEWTQRMQGEVDSLHEDLSQVTEDEQRRRRKWAASYNTFLNEGRNTGDALIDLQTSKPRNAWPFVSRDEIFAYIDDLRALNIDEAVQNVVQRIKDLDAPVRKPKARTFKNGSVHDLASSSILRNGDDPKLLQEEKTRLEDRLRASDSRVRKLEDLLHRQSQMQSSRQSTSSFVPGGASDFGRHTPSPVSFGKQTELPRLPTTSLRRLSNTTDEKGMVHKISALEAQVSKLQEEAHHERRSSTEHRDKMEEAELVKKDLMANFNASRQEFEDERQLMDDENQKLKIRIEELMDELDSVLGSKEHTKLTSEQKMVNLRSELDQLRKASTDELEQAQRKSEDVQRDLGVQRDRAATFEKQLNQTRDERNATQYQNMDLAGQLRAHEEQHQDVITQLQSAHANLSPAGSPPEEMRRLVNALEILSEGAAIYARGLDDSLQLATAENKSLEERLAHAEKQVKAFTDKLAHAELKSASATEGLEQEKGKLKAARSEFTDLQTELSDLRSKLSAGETGSDVLRERLASEERKTAELQNLKYEHEATIQNFGHQVETLSQESGFATAKLDSLTKKLEARGEKARQLSERLYQHNDRIVRMLEQFGYSITRQDESLVIQRASKTNASTILGGTEASIAMKRTFSGAVPTQHYSDPTDLETLYWTSDTESSNEDLKYNGFLTALQRLDLDATVDVVTKRYKDVENLAKKYQKESRAYRDKAHRLQGEAHDKIAYRSFKDGDLALFLPTRNQATRPWAAFNVGAPHYFLREQDTHKLQSRDWLLARINRVEERVVDLSRSLTSATRASMHTETSDAASTKSFDDENPFELSDGLRWYMIDAAEEKPGAPGTPSVGKSTVIASAVDVRAHMGRKEKGSPGSAGAVQVTKNLNKSLESRRSSSASKRSGSFKKTDSSSIKDAPAPLAPIVSDTDGQAEPSVRPSDSDARAGQSAREDAKVFDVVRRDLLMGP